MKKRNYKSGGCPDFRKNGLRFLWKQLLFVLRYALQVDDDSMLKSRYFAVDDLNAILAHNNYSSSYIQGIEKNRRTQQSLKEILQTHQLYNQPQEVMLIYKIGRSAKCHGRSCKAIISSGTLFLWVKDVLTVAYGRNVAVEQDFYFNVAAEQDFYFCSTRKCLANMPVWSNISYPTQVEAEGILDSEKSDVQKDLGIPLV